MASEIRTVAVIGCGVIGAGWTALFLSRGLRVIIFEPAAQAEETFKAYLERAWPALKASVPSCQDEFAASYEFVDSVESHLPKADFVQENGPERIEVKQELMASLDQHAKPGVVIASSSSGLPASTFIQKCQNDPSRVLIAHPFNPPHLVPLVEVVPHAASSDVAISTAIDFYKSLGKKPILIRQEIPGFVANRLQAAINNEAYSLVSRGIVSAEDLDTAITSGPGLRWALTGPFVTNALGGGGGPQGFTQRLERLGPGIRAWEEDMLQHRFDWEDDKVSTLNSEASRWLDKVDWARLDSQKDEALLDVLVAKSKMLPPEEK